MICIFGFLLFYLHLPNNNRDMYYVRKPVPNTIVLCMHKNRFKRSTVYYVFEWYKCISFKNELENSHYTQVISFNVVTQF